MEHARTTATLKDWEQTLASLDELSLDELQALPPQTQSAISNELARLKSGQAPVPESRKLVAVMEKVLRGVERRLTRLRQRLHT